MKIAYLVSRYPSVHHTFILREIRTLRGLGWEIPVVSIRRPIGVLGPEERGESAFVRTVTSAGFSVRMVAGLRRHATEPRDYEFALYRGPSEQRLALVDSVPLSG